MMVSNQDGLGTEAFPFENFELPQRIMLQTLEGEGVVFDEILIDPSFPEEHSPFRKPETGMVRKYLNEYLDYENSYVIGDRKSDMLLARNMGLKGIFFGDSPDEDLPVVLSTTSWREIAAFLKRGSRKAKIVRRTKETEVAIELDLNGSGNCSIHTGLSFFDHMLEQIARHGGLDLSIQVAGDLDVDEHHTIEDTGIVLGECLAEALGGKKGIERYVLHCLWMKQKLRYYWTSGGRIYLDWKARFEREYVGIFQQK